MYLIAKYNINSRKHGGYGTPAARPRTQYVIDDILFEWRPPAPDP
jgi:hypothetical protein